MAVATVSRAKRQMPDRAQGAGLNAAALHRLTTAMQALIDAGRLPGVVMQVERRGRSAYAQALGWQDPSHGPAPAPPMRSDAIFRIYSMTKPLVSTAMMMLVEQGRLQLTDAVAKLLPAFADVRVGVEREGVLQLVPPARAMTVQDLLRHTAGLTYEFHEPSLVRGMYTQANLFARRRSNAEFCDTLAALPLMFSPGARWEYSRATDVLGRLIEVLSGEPLGAHLHRVIFAPLGMTDTGFHVPAAQQHRLAQGFATDPDSGATIAMHDVRTPPTFESGGGGLVSTAADYMRFCRLLLNGGQLDGVRLVGRHTLAFMTADHIDTQGADGTRRDQLPPGYGFGLGFAVRTHPGMSTLPSSVGSFGWSGAAGTLFIVDPAEQLTAVLMVQALGQAAEVRALFQSLVYAALDD